MISALVPNSQGEKVVNYPTRPVDTTTDFEGTTSLQPSQPVWLHGFTTKWVVLCSKAVFVEVQFY